jgi:hypothetical protein
MLRPPQRLIFSILLLLAWFSNAIPIEAQCGGTERWAVKVGTDPRAGNIDQSTRTAIELLDLIGQLEPSLPPGGQNATRLDAEMSIFVVRGRLVKFKLEADSDYHMVITDDTLNFTPGGPAPPSGHSFVAEIPDPSCIPGKHGDPFVQSAFSAGIRKARAELEAQFQNIDRSGAFNDAGGVPVELVGVAFFDFAHGQVGRAPNNIEIHPVLHIAFNPPPPGSGFALSANPTQVSIPQGGAASSVIVVSATGKLGTAISLSVSGMPPSGTATLNPVSISTSEGGSSTLALTADKTTPPGSYNLTITGTGNGATETATIALNISARAPPPSVSITSPADRATVSRVVDLMAQPGGPGAVKLEIYIDGDLKACNFGSSSISYSWDTRAMPNGTHTIISKAYNAAGAAGTSSTVTVTVFN